MFEEIVVTAQKRAQSLQDVPISMSVLQGAEMVRQGVNSFEDINGYVPNLNISKSPSTDIIIMRGIGSGAGSLSLEQSVVMFIDGVYGGRARQFQAPFLDIDRIEVLRGPQGALVGKNTSAGAINISTARPTDEFEAKASAEYDFVLHGGSVTGVVSGPVNDKLRLRLAAKYDNFDGYLKNSLTDSNDPSRENGIVRGTAVYQNDDLEVVGKVEYSEFNIKGQPFQIVSESLGLKLGRDKASGSALGKEFDRTKAFNSAINVNYGLGEHTLTAITGLSHYKNRSAIDADFSWLDLGYSTFAENFYQISQELRLLSPTKQTIDYIFGVYYHHSRLEETRTTAVVLAPVANTLRNFNQNSDVVSAFGQLTWNISDTVRANGSVRFTHEKKTADFEKFTGLTAIPNGIGVPNPAFSDSLSENQVDPSVNLQWDATQDLMLYASFARGSKGGGFQGGVANATKAQFQFKDEKSQSFEGGAKFTLGGRGFINVAGYYTEYKNLQLSVALANTGAAGFDFYTGNAGEARVYGLEADGLVYLTEGLKLRGSLAYLNSEFTNYPDGPCGVGQVPTDPVKKSCSLTGATLPYAPKWSGSITAEYDQPLSSTLKLNAQSTVSFRDDARMDFSNDPRAVQKAYAKLDLRLGIGDIDDKWEIALLGRNLTNKYTFGFSSPAAMLNGQNIPGFAKDARAQTLETPRTVAIQASMKF